MDLSRYPMDNQTCEIHMESCECNLVYYHVVMYNLIIL